MGRTIYEMESMNVTIHSLEERIKRLSSENLGMGEEVREAQ